MIDLRVTLQYRGLAGTTPADAEHMVEESMRDLGAFWHGQYLPMHFEMSAYSRYGFQGRTAAYQRRKWRLFGHNRPMEFTGVMKRSVLGSARIEADPKGARVTVRGVRALNFTSRPNYPDFKNEITATNAEELDRFARRLDGVVQEKLTALNASRAQAVAMGDSEVGASVY